MATDSIIIQRAATIMKVLRLSAEPGMDEVAIKLNMTPTYDELKVAEAWAKAFVRAADTEKKVFEHAMEMRHGR